MTKKRPVEAKPENSSPEAAFYSWDGKVGEDFLKNSAEALKSYSSASRYNDFSNLAPNLSGRPEYNRSHYDYFRPGEATPKDLQKIINVSDNVYQRVGLIRNVIDLMGDFACQGVRLSHPVKNIERFYKKWFEMVSGSERSERFLNNLYRTANVVVRKQTYKATLGDTRKLKAKGEPDSDRPVPEKPGLREIPNKYIFLNPTTVEIIGGPLASFVGIKQYAIKIPSNLARIIKSPRNAQEKELVSQLPEDIKRAAESNQPYPLPPDKTLVYHYKKDDWLPWAYPMIHAILDDIKALDKLRLADLSALDGAISNIRVWLLGDMEHKIAPTRAASEKLASLLQNNVGGGTKDLIWGPDLKLIESNTSVHQFLGEEKYKPCLTAIYSGLGIPPTLTGTFGAAGTTNNFISLRTLTERLQYGRKVLTEFWNHEVRLIQKAFGFAVPPLVEFDFMNLANEEAMLALYIQLADRNIISEEALSHIFKQPYALEQARMNREEKERKGGRRSKKSSPFHDPDIEAALKKIALQSGQASPSQVGLELEPKKAGEKSGSEHELKMGELQIKLGELKLKQSQFTAKQQAIKDKKAGGVGGRPKTAKDSKKRKTKRFTPRAKAEIEVYAAQAQEQIAAVLNPYFLECFGKGNFRQLTNAEAQSAEHLKLGVLLNIETPFTVVNEDFVQVVMEKPFPKRAANMVQVWTRALTERLGREPTLPELHQLYTSLYASYIEELHGTDSTNI